MKKKHINGIVRECIREFLNSKYGEVGVVKEETKHDLIREAIRKKILKELGGVSIFDAGKSSAPDPSQTDKFVPQNDNESAATERKLDDLRKKTRKMEIDSVKREIDLNAQKSKAAKEKLRSIEKPKPM